MVNRQSNAALQLTVDRQRYHGPVPRVSAVREVPVTVVGQIDSRASAAIVGELGAQRTLGDVLAWGRKQRPARTVTDIITQDEYTHDVVVALDAPHYLVFDTT